MSVHQRRVATASAYNDRVTARAETTLASTLADAAAITRAHILAIGAVAAVVFGWIIGGRYLWAVGALAGLDWFLINVMNRVTDVAEDAANGIRGTALVARRARLITVGAWVLLLGSIALGHLWWPELTPWRIAVQVIGLGYNYPIVPSLRGLTRFKEMYFWKNFGSALLFVLTCFVYPLATLHADGAPRLVSDAGIAALILFFIPFELTYEILYDLRDLDGDRAEGVPTYPVVHGPDVARRIIDGLLLGASAALVAAVVAGALGLRQLLMLVAPTLQWILYRRWWARGLTPRDCIVLTHAGTAQLVLFLVGTALWQRAGLPADVYL